MEEIIPTASSHDEIEIIRQREKKLRDERVIIVPRSVTCLERGYLSSNVRIQSIEIPSTVSYLGEGALAYCSALRSVMIPDSVTYIGADAFNSCRSLKTVIIPESVFAIRANAFENCVALESIIIPEALTYVEDLAFSDCSSLKSIVLPKELMFVGRSVFDSCHALDKRNTNGLNYQFSTEHWLQNRFSGLPIHQACYATFKNMSTKQFATLIEENRETLAMRDAMGMTPLHILHGNPTAPVEIFRMLKSAYPEAVTAVDVNGMSPIMLLYACKSVKSSCFFDSIYDGPSLSTMFRQGLRLEDIKDLEQHDDEKIFLTEMREGDRESGIYPFMSAASCSQYDLTTVFELILKCPEMFHQFQFVEE